MASPRPTSPLSPTLDRTSEFRRSTSPSPSQLEQGVSYIPQQGRSPRPKEPPEIEAWLNALQELNSLLEKMRTGTGNIEKLHKQALLNGKSDEMQMEALTQSFSQSATRCRHLLDTMSVRSQESSLRRASLDNARQRFVKVMSEYETVLREQRERYRKHIQRQYLLINPQASTNDLERLEAATGYGQITGDPHVLTATLFASALKQDANQGLLIMEERLSDMQRLEASVREVAQLWTDLALIVSTQGEKIQKLSKHVSQIEGYTEKATKETESAVVKVKTKRSLKIVIFGIIAFLLFILIIYLIIEFADIYKTFKK